MRWGVQHCLCQAAMRPDAAALMHMPPAPPSLLPLTAATLQFKGLDNKQSKSWVEDNNLVAVFEAPNSRNRKVRVVDRAGGVQILAAGWLCPRHSNQPQGASGRRRGPGSQAAWQGGGRAGVLG